MERELLDMDETSAMLGVGKPRAYELVRLGILPHVRLGRQIRVSRKALEEFIVQGGCGLPSASQRRPRPTLPPRDPAITDAGGAGRA